jgi:hypothetical protein
MIFLKHESCWGILDNKEPMEVIMKKILIILSFLMITSAASAQILQLGPVAMLTTPVVTPSGVSSYDSLGLEDFRFGADARLNLGLLQIGLLAVIEAPGTDALLEPGEIILVPTIGVNTSLLIFDVGIGIGPSFEFNYGDSEISDPADFGIHLKGTFDVNFGSFSTGLILGSALDLTRDVTDFGERVDIYGGLVLLFNL